MTITVSQAKIVIDADATGAQRSIDGLTTAEQKLATEGRRASAAQNDLAASLAKTGSVSADAAAGLGKVALGVGAIVAAAATAGAGVGVILDKVKEAGFGLNATLETATLQFTTLYKDAELGAAKVTELFEFANKTPFESGPIIEAARLMRTLGGAAFDTSENLRLIGDASAGVSTDIKEVALWVSRAYADIQAGRPFGQAAARLNDMGILAGETRNEMERLQAVGASGARVWALLAGELGQFAGSMDKMQATWAGLTSTATDTIDLLVAGAMKPLFDEAKIGLGELNRILASNEAEEWGKALAKALRDDVIPELRKAAGLARGIGGLASGAAGAVANSPAAQLGGAVVGSHIDTYGRIKNQIEGAMGATSRATEEGLQRLRDQVEAQWEDIQLEDSISMELGRQMAAGVTDAVEEAMEEAQGIRFADRITAALGVEDAAARMGAGGAEMVDAFTKGLTDQTDKQANTIAQAARKLRESWRKELDPGEAAARDVALMSALGGDDADALSTLLTGYGDQDEGRRAREEARKQTEATRREQEAAAREAERIANEAWRNQPLTGANFGAAFSLASESASFGAGRGMYDAARAAQSGGIDAIQAFAQMAADARQRMLDTFTVDDAETWASGLMDAVEAVVHDKTPEAAAAVANYVREFTIHRQLTEEGERAERAINEATDKADEAIKEAQRQAHESATRLQQEFDISRGIQVEMDRLQDVVKAGMRAAREGFDEGARELQRSRQMADQLLRYSREDEGVERGQSRQNRDLALSRQRAREDLQRDLQRRMTEIGRGADPTGRATAQQEAQRQYQERLQDMSFSEGRVDADRARQRADAQQDRERARQEAAQDQAMQQTRAEADRQRQRQQERDLEVLQKLLEAPIKQIQLGEQQRQLQQQLNDLRKNEAEQVHRVNAALDAQIAREKTVSAEVERRQGYRAPAGVPLAPTQPDSLTIDGLKSFVAEMFRGFQQPITIDQTVEVDGEPAARKRLEQLRTRTLGG